MEKHRFICSSSRVWFRQRNRFDEPRIGKHGLIFGGNGAAGDLAPRAEWRTLDVRAAFLYFVEKSRREIPKFLPQARGPPHSHRRRGAGIAQPEMKLFGML